jgi:hypothetical protein
MHTPSPRRRDPHGGSRADGYRSVLGYCERKCWTNASCTYQEIPDDVWRAYEELVKAGYDKYLLNA